MTSYVDLPNSILGPTPRPACCNGAPALRITAHEAARLSDILKALSHPVRLQIVDLLSRHGGEVCVCDIESQFALKQPTISHHLKILRKAGLIDYERRGSWAYYFIRAEQLEPLRELIRSWIEPAAPAAERIRS